MNAEETTHADTRRQRVRSSLNHIAPDRVPIDFGGTSVSGIHVSCVIELRRFFGLEERFVKVWEPYQMLGTIDDDLMDAMGIDVVGITAPKTMFGFANEKWKLWQMNGQEVLVPGDFNTRMDSNGDTLIYPAGDLSVPPSGRMPLGGQFFDAIIRQRPISEDTLDPSDNLEEFQPISAEDLRYFDAASATAADSGRAVIANFGGTAFGDIALVPAPFLKGPRGIRDVAEWYVSTASRRDYVHRVFDGQCEIALSNLEKIHAVVGDRIEVLYTCGTDFGTQTSAFCSVKTFRDLYFPYYRRLNDWIHKNTSWKIFKHSCGSVERFMESFIEAGFDIINPVQCSAVGMKPDRLKERYGGRLTFWGGGVDTQHTLPFGTPAEVREEVLRRCEIFAPKGGFVFSSIHNVQAGTPVANIVAMIDAVREFNE